MCMCNDGVFLTFGWVAFTNFPIVTGLQMFQLLMSYSWIDTPLKFEGTLSEIPFFDNFRQTPNETLNSSSFSHCVS
jgi:hypothetical protein